MTRKNLPKQSKDFLLLISEIVRKFNTSGKVEIISDSTENLLIGFYPRNYPSLSFSIYNIDFIKKDDKSSILTPIYNYLVNYDSVKIIKSTFSGVSSKPYVGLANEENLLEAFNQYLDTIEELVLQIAESENVELDLKDFFIFENEEIILKNSDDLYSSSEKILPVCLKQLVVKDFQGIYELKIESIPIDIQWVFLIGENGFGKTSVLQSIFLGLNGPLDVNTNLIDSKKTSIKLEYKKNDIDIIKSLSENESPLIHLAAYGPGRLNLQGASSENAEDRNSSVSYNLFNSDGFLFNINAELVKWALKDDKRFDLIKKAFCTLIPNLADIRFNKETDQIEYIEKEISVSNDRKVTYQPLPFQKLASGFKSIIALAGDIIVRLTKNQKEVKDPSDLVGIVLIDEIDLHLHPKLQKQLIGSFSKVFPKIQFIVSTHSPIPLLGAPENSMIFKVTRNKIDGVQIEEVKIDLKNLTPNLVLTSGIFDMEDFVSVQNEDITQVRTEDSFEEMKHNDEVEKYLKDFEKSDKNFPDELFLSKSK